MNRLVRAEWYRLTHWRVLIRWSLIVCAACLFFSIFATTENIFAMQLSDYMECMGESIFGAFFMFVPIYVSVMVGLAYNNKTAYYSVMSGNKIFDILVSKVFVYALSMAVLMSVSYLALFSYLTVKNGAGTLGRLPLRAVMLFLIIFHACAIAVLLTTAVRHIAAAACIYLYFNVFHLAVSLSINLLRDSMSEEMYNRISAWVLPSQMLMVLIPKWSQLVDGYLLFVIIASMIVEMFVWYGISYAVMKKRLYR